MFRKDNPQCLAYRDTNTLVTTTQNLQQRNWYLLTHHHIATAGLSWSSKGSLLSGSAQQVPVKSKVFLLRRIRTSARVISFFFYILHFICLKWLRFAHLSALICFPLQILLQCFSVCTNTLLARAHYCLSLVIDDSLLWLFECKKVKLAKSWVHGRFARS